MATPDVPTPRRRRGVLRRREAIATTGAEVETTATFDMVPTHKAQAKSPALRRAVEYIDDIAGRHRSNDLEWQLLAYEMLDEVGEAGYVAHLTANTISMCGLPVRRKGKNGALEEIPEGEAIAQKCQRVMDNLEGRTGGQKEIKRRLGLHGVTAGEWSLVGTDHAADGLLWEVLSVQELHIDPGGKITRSTFGDRWEEVPPGTYVAPGHVSDPLFSGRSTSQMRRALSTCREIVAHSQVVEASSKSRVAAGLLFVPDELSFGDDDADEDEEMDALTEELLRHLSAPVKDKASQAAYVPLVIRGKGELGAMIQLIDLGRDLDQTAVDLRERALHRLANILDVPPEKISGKGGLNHWTGFNVDADFLTNHVAPLGAIIADFLTQAYLRPMLVLFEGVSPDEAAQLVIEFDTSSIAVRGDEAASGRALHDRDVLSDEALVRSAGYDTGEMPEDDELFVRRAWKLITGNPAYAKALLPHIPGFESIKAEDLPPNGATPAPGAAVGPGGEQLGLPPGAKAPEHAPAPADKKLPDESGPPPMKEPVPPGGSPDSKMAMMIAQLITGADMAIERATERAAARVAQAAQKGGLGDRIPADRATMFTRIGPSDLASLHVDIEAQFVDAWDRFMPRCRTWVRDWATDRGMTPLAADDIAVLVTDELCEKLTDWVLANLHREGAHVPTALVEDAVRLYAGAVK